MKFYGNKEEIARFVEDMLQHFDTDSLSITITGQGLSVVCYVSIVIDMSLEDTVKNMALNYSLRRITT